MTEHKRLEPGYPAHFYTDRRRSWIWLCWPVGFLGLFAAGFGYVLSVGAGGKAHVAAFVFVLLLILVFIIGNIHAWRKARVYPYYDKFQPNAGTYLRGQAILRNLVHLDRLAESRAVKSISAFGLPDVIKGEKVVWHDDAEGLRTIEGLIQALTEKPDSVNNAPAVIADLERIRRAFERAKAEGVRFSFLIDEMGGTNAMVWGIRGGHV